MRRCVTIFPRRSISYYPNKNDGTIPLIHCLPASPTVPSSLSYARSRAQIGQNVNRDELQQLEWNLLGEAKTLFHQRKFEEALNTFTHCLAVTEKTRSAKDHAVRGAVIHNIASCLHNLGEMEAAQAYYEQAIDAFKKAKVPMLERVIYGDANKKRMDFVKERLVDITWGRKPDGDKYLDENGNKRPVPGGLQPLEPEMVDSQLSEEWRAGAPRLPSWATQPRDDHGAGGDYSGGGGSDYAGGSHSGSGSCEPGGYGGGDAAGTYMSPRYSDAPGGYGAPPDPRDDTAGSYGAAREEARHEAARHEVAGEEEEAARKEWLQYHMEMAEWDKAAELVVTREEQEDLDYLIQRARRMPPSAPKPAAGRTSGQRQPGGAASSGRPRDDEEDGML